MEANPNRVRVPVAEFAAKASNKNEIYNLLTQDVRCHLPAKECVTIHHLRDLSSGVKRIVSSNNIRHIDVPFYHEELSVEKVLAWVKQQHPDLIGQYFPPPKEMDKLPRQVSAIQNLFIRLESIFSSKKKR